MNYRLERVVAIGITKAFLHHQQTRKYFAEESNHMKWDFSHADCVNGDRVRKEPIESVTEDRPPILC